MNTDIVIGLQWGDEGKGKIVDLLADKYDVVLRANGGNNAGHSISIENKTFAVHALPSGVLQSGVKNIIGPGCVVNPNAILEEINKLKDNFKGELYISNKCPLVMEKYIREDIVKEQLKGDKSIGTTQRGIGPTYAALKNREVFLVGDLLNIDKALERNVYTVLEKNELKIELTKYKEIIGKYICDINKVINSNQKILIEGAQATMLDNNYGTYPYVTSSNTTVPGLLVGASLNHKSVKDVIGVTKAYCTRVGNGPFLTEDLGEDGEKICEIGKEVGVSTGRKRRCGWLDLVQLNYAIQLNGVDSLAIMKSDILDSFKKIKLCVSYKNKFSPEVINFYPHDIENYEPVYIELDGWESSTYGLTEYDSLPDNLINFLNEIKDRLNIDIKYISTGPERDSTIIK